MTIRASIHVHQDEEVNIFEYTGDAGKYIVLHIGEADQCLPDSKTN